MASLKKRPGSPYYVACYTKADGTRTQRSTKQTNRDEATKVLVECMEAERLARQSLLTEIQARKIVSEIVERTTGEAITFYSVEEWLRTWLKDKTESRSKGTAVRYEKVIEDFLKHLGHRKALNLSAITPSDIQSFRESEKKKRKSAKTCNLSVKVLGAGFNRARRNGLIQTNPAEALDSLPVSTPEKGVFTAEQVADLVAHAEGDWKGAILLGYFGGPRLSDVANMRWEAVDLAGSVLSFVPGKTKQTKTKLKKTTLPIHPDFERWLLSQEAPDDPHAFLFPSLAGRGTGGAHGLSRQFKRIMEDAGIDDGLADTGDGKRRQSRLSFHSLRHSFNSAMANAGVPQEIRQALASHSSAEMNNVYTHLEMKTLREAIAVIPSVTEPGPGR